jgi:hypothetical protein
MQLHVWENAAEQGIHSSQISEGNQAEHNKDSCTDISEGPIKRFRILIS